MPRVKHIWKTIETCHCARRYIKICSIQTECPECCKHYWGLILLKFRYETKKSDEQVPNKNEDWEEENIMQDT
jgi:hypothetical protein